MVVLLDTNVVSKLIRKTYNSADSVPEFDVSRLASYPSRMPRPVATIELTDSERAEPHRRLQLTHRILLTNGRPKDGENFREIEPTRETVVCAGTGQPDEYLSGAR